MGGFISLDGDNYYTGFYMEENLNEGSLEFFFKPHESFFNGAAQALVGNNGARLLVYYFDGMLMLMMNRTNEFRYVGSPVTFNDGWNYVCVEWGNDFAYLFLDNQEIAKMELENGYVASYRDEEHEIIVGYKSSCCMSGVNLQQPLYTSADFGPIRISSVMRKTESNE